MDLLYVILEQIGCLRHDTFGSRSSKSYPQQKINNLHYPIIRDETKNREKKMNCGLMGRRPEGLHYNKCYCGLP